MSNNNLIRCSKINVDCVANDPVDIRCGGPDYLGFDFNVREEQTEDIKKFIAVTLESLEVPLVNLYVSGTIDLSEEDVWTKERIVKAVKDDAEYLQGEAERNYGSSFRR
ncbi:MAG: hypothetical protein IJB71_04055 [Bacilli bacterium]|nr:hypothetical protein [Bacilli bacterium]